MCVNMVRMKRNLSDRMKIKCSVVGRVVEKHLRSLLYSLITDVRIRKRNNADAPIVEPYSVTFQNFTIISGDNPLQVSIRSVHAYYHT